MRKIIRIIVIGALLIYLGLGAVAFIVKLWNVTIGDLLIHAAPLIIIYLIIEAYIYIHVFIALREEKKWGHQSLYRIFLDEKKLYHRSYCRKTIVNRGNLIIVKNPEKAREEGLSPCPKCRPPVSSQPI